MGIVQKLPLTLGFVVLGNNTLPSKEGQTARGLQIRPVQMRLQDTRSAGGRGRQTEPPDEHSAHSFRKPVERFPSTRPSNRSNRQYIATCHARPPGQR